MQDNTAPISNATIGTPTPRRIGRKRGAITIAAIALAFGALICVIMEAVVAAAWTHPTYSYINDYIAYLGSPDCGPYNGQIVCSPGWVAMDTTWIIEGLLVAVAGLLLAIFLTRRVAIATIVLAGAQGLGFVLFAVYHNSSSAKADGTIVLYYIGAALVIGAGNILPIVLGAVWRQLRLSRAVGVTSIILGVVGLVSAIATFGWLTIAIGLIERISTYSFLLWQLVFAAALVGRLGASREIRSNF